jgi:deoxyribose-phosphate aldolase
MTTHPNIPHRLIALVLKPEALANEVHKVATDTLQGGLWGIATAPVWTHRVATLLSGSGAKLCSVVAFPHGNAKSTVKAIEATSTIKDGADEIAVVAHLVHLIRHDVDSARAELMETVRAARSTRRDVFIKVVIELGLLMQLPPQQREPAVVTACRAVRESGCDAIVTATTFHPCGDAPPSAIALLKQHAQSLSIEAWVSHADASARDALAAAGADRIASVNYAAFLAG